MGHADFDNIERESEDLREEEAKICGCCFWIRKPHRWTIERLRKAAEEGPVPLLREVDALRRQRFWCSREACWTHLLDNACSLWQPIVP